jgi:hypothetical protein
MRSARLVRKTRLLEPFLDKNDHFTKTGSTNIGKTKNRRRFVQACVGMTSLSCLMAGWCTQR